MAPTDATDLTWEPPTFTRRHVRTARDAFAVDRNGPNVEGGKAFSDPRNPFGPIVAAPAENADSVAVAPADKSEAVVPNLIGPLRAGRDCAGKRR